MAARETRAQVDFGVCPKCGAAIRPSAITRSEGEEPVTERFACQSCGAKLVRNEHDLWREDTGSPNGGASPPGGQS